RLSRCCAPAPRWCWTFPPTRSPAEHWMRGIVDDSGTAHQLHYLDVPDEVCRARLRKRNAAGTHDFAASDAEFDMITSHFVAPVPDEGFTVVVHREV